MDSLGFFVSVLFLSAACAELQVSVFSPKTADLGSDVLLECTFKVEQSPMDLQYLAVSWLHNEKVLLTFDKTLRVSEPRASLDQSELSNGNVSLVLSNVTVNDEGTYTCSVIYSPRKEQKDITLKVQARPVIILLEQDVIKGKENLLRCSVVGFYPKDIDVFWLRGRNRLPASSNSQPQNYTNGTFMINSTLPLNPTDSDEGQNFSCHVRHSSLPNPLHEEAELKFTEEEKGINATALVVSLLVIGVIVAVLGWFLYRRMTHKKLTLSYIQGPDNWTVGDPVELVCVGHHCPKDIEIKWTKLHGGNKTEIEASSNSEPQEMEPLLSQNRYRVKTVTSNQDKHYSSITSTLIITPSREEDEGATFKCNFITKDRKLNEVKEFKDFELQVKPQVMGPIKCSPCDVNSVLCSLELQQFYPKEIQIKWSCGAGDLKHISSEEQETENAEKRTFNIRTECTIPEEAFKDPKYIIRVTWQHVTLEEPGYKEMSVTDPDFPGRPLLDDITVPQLINGKEASLHCRVSRYFPKELHVEWMNLKKDGKLERPFGTIDLEHREAGEGYSCTACLKISALRYRYHTSTFMCRVSHVSLESALVKNTGKLVVAVCPRFEEMTMTPSEENQILTLDIGGYYPSIIAITWSCAAPEEPWVLPSTVKSTTNSDGSFAATSTCELSKSMIDRIGTSCIKVTTEHETLQEPLAVSVQLTRSGGAWGLKSQTPGWKNRETLILSAPQ